MPSRERNLCIGFTSPLTAALLSTAEDGLRYAVLGSACNNSLYMLARIASSGYNIVVTHICDSLPKNVQRKKVLTPNTPSVIKIIIIIVIIIMFLHRLGRLTCSRIDALPSFPLASTISSSSCKSFKKNYAELS